MPSLFELLLRTLHRHPQRLDDIAVLLRSVRNSADDGEPLFPPGFEEIWEPIWRSVNSPVARGGSDERHVVSARVLPGLKAFQRDTVDYVFKRMYQDSPAATRFLVADEVGLGKTLVARGLVARAIDRLQEVSASTSYTSARIPALRARTSRSSI